VLGDIARALGELDRAEPYLRESLAILDDVGDAYEAARSRLSLAHVYTQQDQAAQAATVLDQCIAVFEQLDARLDLAAARALWQHAGA
jgi:tetratricopeptide (TPR) repeat protein